MRVPVKRGDFTGHPNRAGEQGSGKGYGVIREVGSRATVLSTMGHGESHGDTGAGGGGGGGCEMCVMRPALNVTQRASSYDYHPPHRPRFLESVQTKVAESCACSGSCILSTITNRVPILTWLPAYSIRSSLFGDTVAGCTVAIMHIPQGMAYALLGGLPPITGIYMAFFPVLMYIIFGTSHHCSVGTFAVVCLMTGKVVGDFATDPTEDPDALLAGNATEGPTYTPNQVAAIVALMNGIIGLVLGALQLGTLCVFLSDMLVSGFTTGAAVHVLTSQIKYLFGLKVPRYSGPFKIIYTYRDLISQLLAANPAAMVISGVTIAVLALNNEVIKPWFRTKTKIPIPIELIAVIIGTLASYFGHLHENYDIRIVGEIPTGLPIPTAPPFELIPDVAVDSIVITIVAYTVSFSMAKIFAKRHSYQVDATQELYALGISNVFGSFFGCAPVAVSLSRSLIQEAVGGVTQITSLICCCLLLIVLLFIGPVFESLPNCVLSAIIVVALKGMFLQVHDLKRVWVVSRTEGMIWLSAFLGVVIIDIDYGLVIGIIVSLVVLLSRTQQPKTARLGHVPNTDLYLDVKKYSAVVEIPTVSIFQFGGPLHFANTEYFQLQLVSMTGLDASSIATTKSLIQKQLSETDIASQSTKEVNGSATTDNNNQATTKGAASKGITFIKNKFSGTKKPKEVTLAVPEVQWLVIEMSGVSYVDTSGGNLLVQLYKDYKKAGIVICLAATSESVLESLEICGTLKVIPRERIFHSTHDAIMVLTHPEPTTVADNSCTKL